ncbi:hypothetical protein B0H16DRAFT_1747481 [Mycena metata]|uniref:Uncharacterized protein n=1 Tax=Mycena metata TaxID=1033252 RepID=A0AAD7GTC0_9AGAR|nr:hypothetical protein B0H16DRAFT_1747481 [Mycena metata]
MRNAVGWRCVRSLINAGTSARARIQRTFPSPSTAAPCISISQRDAQARLGHLQRSAGRAGYGGWRPTRALWACTWTRSPPAYNQRLLAPNPPSIGRARSTLVRKKVATHAPPPRLISFLEVGRACSSPKSKSRASLRAVAFASKEDHCESILGLVGWCDICPASLWNLIVSYANKNTKEKLTAGVRVRGRWHGGDAKAGESVQNKAYQEVGRRREEDVRIGRIRPKGRMVRVAVKNAHMSAEGVKEGRVYVHMWYEYVAAVYQISRAPTSRYLTALLRASGLPAPRVLLLSILIFPFEHAWSSY